MKKNLRKFALALTISLMFNSISINMINVFAEEKAGVTKLNSTTELSDVTKLNTLTVSEALTKAISYSSKLKTISENDVVNKLDYDDTKFELTSTSESSAYTNLAVRIKQLLNQMSNSKSNTEIEKQSLELEIIEFFTAVKEAENDLELYKKNLDLKEKQLNITKTKYSLGLVSEVDYNSAVNSYNKLVSEKEDKETTIKNAFISLNKVLGEDLETRYNLELAVEYKPFEAGNIELLIKRAKTSSQTVVEKKQAIEIAKYQVDRFYTLNSNATQIDKESSQFSVAQSQRNLETTQTTLEETIRKLYNNILQNESDYKTAQADLVKLKSDYELIKTKYNLGKATELDLQQAEYNIAEKENDIQSLIYNHDIMIRQYSNINLL